MGRSQRVLEQDNLSSPGISRSNSFATESLLGQDEGNTAQAAAESNCESLNREEWVEFMCSLLGEPSWADGADRMFSQASKDGSGITWANLLDFYIQVDKERSRATVLQPIHHDGDFKAAQHSR